jgi:hypothetical protein
MFKSDHGAVAETDALVLRSSKDSISTPVKKNTHFNTHTSFFPKEKAYRVSGRTKLPIKRLHTTSEVQKKKTGKKVLVSKDVPQSTPSRTTKQLPQASAKKCFVLRSIASKHWDTMDCRKRGGQEAMWTDVNNLLTDFDVAKDQNHSKIVLEPSGSPAAASFRKNAGKKTKDFMFIFGGGLLHTARSANVFSHGLVSTSAS